MLGKKLRKYMPALVASSLGILLTINAGVASAGIGVLRPGAGNNPPKTPDWNVKNQEGGSGAVTTKDGKSVQKRDKSKKTTVTMLSVMLGESLSSVKVSASGDFELVDGNGGKVLGKMPANVSAEVKISGGAVYLNGEKLASRIITLRTGKGQQVVYNGSSYRGQLRLVYDGSGIQVLNIVA